MNQKQIIYKEKKEWWQARRLQYNKYLALSGIVAFVLWIFLASLLIAPYVEDFEISLFTSLFQGTGYLVMMGIANLFYNLGYLTDKYFNKTNSEQFRLRFYKLGCYFSCFLPFLVPIITVIEYFVLYAGKQPIH